MEKKSRTPIPPKISAEALFKSDRTCCVCRDKNKKIQIHHIDENPDNNEIDNLAVLCIECHDDTQIRGGFGRKLDSFQIKLYRDDWYRFVEQSRSYKTPIASKAIDSIASKKVEDAPIQVEVTFGSTNYELGNPYGVYIFTAKNFGANPITFTGLYIELPQGHKLYYATPIYSGQLPYKLESDDSFFITWPISDLQRYIQSSEFKGLKETRAYFVDRLDRKYYSNLFPLV